MCPDRRRARRTVSALLEVAMQSAFQGKFSYTTPFRGVMGGVLVMVRQTRTFAVASEMGRNGVSVAVAAAFASSSAISLPGMPL